jgi:formate dehydrogenase
MLKNGLVLVEDVSCSCKKCSPHPPTIFSGLEVVAALYADLVDGHPPRYFREPGLNTLLDIGIYPDGQTLPSPSTAGNSIQKGKLLGCVSGELGLRKVYIINARHLLSAVHSSFCVCVSDPFQQFLEDRGHTYVVISDKYRGWLLCQFGLSRIVFHPVSQIVSPFSGMEVAVSWRERELVDVDADIVVSQPFWLAYITAGRFEMPPNLSFCMTAGINLLKQHPCVIGSQLYSFI